MATSRSEQPSGGAPAPQEGLARRADVRMGWLFGFGSVCFALGSVPAYFAHVPPAVTAWTFFVGSVAFTSAAVLQYAESVRLSGDGSRPSGRALLRWPHGPDLWASLVQLVGTVCFNVSTFAATRSGLTSAQDRHLVWAPDAYGSVCFLIASWLAWTVARRAHERSAAWWIAVVNLGGSVAFGAAAVGARYVGPDAEVADVALVNAGTFVGAVLFLVGAVLLARPERDA